MNPNKVYDVSPQTRAEILREMLDSDDRCKNVEVKVVTGYIWRYAKTQNASLFFRGIRTWSSDGPEERHLQILNSWGPLLLGPVWPIKTIFLEGHPAYRDVSSTVVREICAEIKERREKGESVTVDAVELAKLIPDHVLEKIVIVYQ